MLKLTSNNIYSSSNKLIQLILYNLLPFYIVITVLKYNTKHFNIFKENLINSLYSYI